MEPGTSHVNIPRLRLGIAALRSGLYPQCKGRLHRINPDDGLHGWCCLGVFTDVAIKLGGLQIPRVTVNDTYSPGYLQEEFGTEHSFLHPSVVAFYGFPSSNPALIVAGGESLSASNYNDNGGADFEKIADAFEYTYITLPGQQRETAS